jgi:hypothetical protein
LSNNQIDRNVVTDAPLLTSELCGLGVNPAGEKDHVRVFASAIAFFGWAHNKLHLVLRLLESVINFSNSSSRLSIERCAETLLGWRSA